MQPSVTLRAAHRPLIRFIGSRKKLWQDVTHHNGPHPLTPANLQKQVAKPDVPAPAAAAAQTTSGAVEYGQLPLRYRRSLLSEAEMEAVESGGATITF
ncbi:hypothetical protein DFQ28_003856 [Apophysomyces sp. BC1034]|nr:hypothetical protein DFQ30_001154 [Apophysomyces sp. BC1015]KAG0182190.1 hypothetical protein DFQ29_005406 [Apophysomyces sp. BC1021]KAG0193683.1 hypothetical protein DFQ28_003856 [Apophysomyces sp. BC1034]